MGPCGLCRSVRPICTWVLSNTSALMYCIMWKLRVTSPEIIWISHLRANTLIVSNWRDPLIHRITLFTLYHSLFVLTGGILRHRRGHIITCIFARPRAPHNCARWYPGKVVAPATGKITFMHLQDSYSATYWFYAKLPNYIIDVQNQDSCHSDTQNRW